MSGRFSFSYGQQLAASMAADSDYRIGNVTTELVTRSHDLAVAEVLDEVKREVYFHFLKSDPC